MAQQLVHLAVIMGHTPTQHCIGAWRAPTAFKEHAYLRPEFWESVGRTLDDGLLDFLLLADQYGVYDTFKGTTTTAIEHGVQFPLHDPMPLVPIIARVTTGLGIAITASTTYLPPYHAARLFSTLDVLSNGRFAWNIVTSYGSNAAKSYGMRNELPKPERYAIAEEFVSICRQLWNSWDVTALRMDRNTGLVVDATKINAVRYAGRHFTIEATHTVPPSQQHHPVLIQAGASRDGLEFAARHADVHFATAGSVQSMKRHMSRIEACSRRVTPMRVLWATSVFIGETDEEGREKERVVRGLVPIDGALAQMSGDLNVDLSAFPRDIPLGSDQLGRMAGIEGVRLMLLADYGHLTLNELAVVYGTGMGGLRFVGAADAVARDMLATLDSGGGHGFVIRCGVLPESLNDIAHLLVPALQRMGRFRLQYASNILRHRLNEC